MITLNPRSSGSRSTERYDRFSRLFDRAKAPLAFEAGDANLYRYVGNQPTVLTDPSGLNPNQQGALDIDELIDLVRVLEDRFKLLKGRFPNYKETIELLLNEQLRVDENGRACGMHADKLTNVNHYYVFIERGDTESWWLDMRHFAETADLDIPTAVIGGGAVEILQSFQRFLQDRGLTSKNTSKEGTGGAASAQGIEDQISNITGAKFNLFYQCTSTGKDTTATRRVINIGRKYERISDYLEEYLRSLGATTKAKSQALPFLPKNEKEWRAWNLDARQRESLEILEGAYVRRPRLPKVGE